MNKESIKEMEKQMRTTSYTVECAMSRNFAFAKSRCPRIKTVCNITCTVMVRLLESYFTQECHAQYSTQPNRSMLISNKSPAHQYFISTSVLHPCFVRCSEMPLSCHNAAVTFGMTRRVAHFVMFFQWTRPESDMDRSPSPKT